MRTLKDKVIFISGASRGIGREIALRCAQDGAILVITGKTSKPHPKLSGTIHSVVDEIEQAGANALALQLDVRDEHAIAAAVGKVVKAFGGIDVLINNASAIQMTHTVDTAMRRFDLMFGVNVRGTFACSQACIPLLAKAKNPHILNLAPPLNMDPTWFKDHVAYTMSKYGMSMCTLGMAAELKEQGIAVNSLWPRTTIATAAIEAHFPDEIMQRSRKPAIMADAAYAILTQDSRQATGNFYLDEEVLKAQGVTDFDQYALDPSVEPYPDLFL